MSRQSPKVGDLLHLSGYKPGDDIPEGWEKIDDTPALDNGHSVLTTFYNAETDTLVVNNYQPTPLIYDPLTQEVRRWDIAERAPLGDDGNIEWVDTEALKVLGAFKEVVDDLVGQYPSAGIIPTASGDAGMVMGWVAQEYAVLNEDFNAAHVQTFTYEAPPYWAGSGADPKGVNVVIEHAPRDVLNQENYKGLNNDEALTASVAQIGIDPGINLAHVAWGSEALGFVADKLGSWYLPDKVGQLAGKLFAQNTYKELDGHMGHLPHARLLENRIRRVHDEYHGFQRQRVSQCTPCHRRRGWFLQPWQLGLRCGDQLPRWLFRFNRQRVRDGFAHGRRSFVGLQVS